MELPLEDLVSKNLELGASTPPAGGFRQPKGMSYQADHLRGFQNNLYMKSGFDEAK